MLVIRYYTQWISMALLIVACASAEDNHHKRVPSGFTGVRGKKSIPDEAYNSDDVENSNSVQQTDSSFLHTENPTPIDYIIEKRAPSGFFGMRGKKPWNYAEEMDKRSMGFVGMRGKKESLDDDYTLDEPSKRAQMGFFGMRGKKYLIEPGYQGDKRASMGFVGMRGKKEYESPSSYFEDSKRAPSGFFGMRGKKHSYGFFGMRGKKYPYEFRGKFVGVSSCRRDLGYLHGLCNVAIYQVKIGKTTDGILISPDLVKKYQTATLGKKSSDVAVPDDYYLESNIGRLGQDLDINQLMLLLTEQNEANNSQ